MSSAEITLGFQEMLQQTRGARPAVLRLALRRGEAVRIPPRRRRLHVLAGTAWVSQAGEDVILESGMAMAARPDRDPAVVSAVGTGMLLLEVL
jgi:hypothetical protein